MSMRVLITRDFDQMSEEAAGIVLRDIADGLGARGRYNLGLATGATPTGLYKHLAKAANGGAFEPGRVRSFNLDEYVGLPGENAQMRALHPESYSYFMVQELFGLMRKKFAETNVPWGCLVEQERLAAALEANPGDWEAQGADKGKAIVIRRDAENEYLRWIRREILDAYAAKIRRFGGIDLHVIGVGGRGHVAFHEAGIPFEGNEVLLVKLDANTVENAVADGHFAKVEDSPQYAVSMGAELVYQARKVLLLASGARKSEPVAESLLRDPTPEVPISYGRNLAARGGDMIYVLDEVAAAGVLARRAEIEARGAAIEDLRGAPAGRKLPELAFTRDPASGLLG